MTDEKDFSTVDNLIERYYGLPSDIQIKCLQPRKAYSLINHRTLQQKLIFNPAEAQQVRMQNDPSLELNEIQVPCGKCFFCLIQKMRSRSLQLIHEAKISSSAIFLTLTYSPKGLSESWNETFNFLSKKLKVVEEKISKLPTVNQMKKQQSLDEFLDLMDPSLSADFDTKLLKDSYNVRLQELEEEKLALEEKIKAMYTVDGRKKLFGLHYRDIQLFMKRLRRYEKYHNNNTGLKFYAAGEHGGKKGRPHFHMILYNASPALIRTFKFRGFSKKNKEIYKSKEMEDIWSLGFVDGSINLSDDAMFYTVGYTLKKQENAMGDEVGHGSAKLGWNYISKYMESIINNGYIINDGRRYSIPACYLNLYKRLEFRSILAQFPDHTSADALDIWRMVSYNISMRKRHARENFKKSLKSMPSLRLEERYARSKFQRDGLVEGPISFADLGEKMFKKESK